MFIYYAFNPPIIQYICSTIYLLHPELDISILFLKMIQCHETF